MCRVVMVTGGGQLFTQNSAGVPGMAEVLDFFGDAPAVGDTGPATTTASPSRNTTPAAAVGRSRDWQS
jgi:hypothetical protein